MSATVAPSPQPSPRGRGSDGRGSGSTSMAMNVFAAELASTSGVSGALDALAVALLLLALVGVATYRLEHAIWLVGGQALILAAVAVTIGAAAASWHVYAAAVLT